MEIVEQSCCFFFFSQVQILHVPTNCKTNKQLNKRKVEKKILQLQARKCHNSTEHSCIHFIVYMVKVPYYVIYMTKKIKKIIQLYVKSMESVDKFLFFTEIVDHNWPIQFLGDLSLLITSKTGKVPTFQNQAIHSQTMHVKLFTYFIKLTCIREPLLLLEQSVL